VTYTAVASQAGTYTNTAVCNPDGDQDTSNNQAGVSVTVTVSDHRQQLDYACLISCPCFSLLLTASLPHHYLYNSILPPRQIAARLLATSADLLRSRASSNHTLTSYLSISCRRHHQDPQCCPSQRPVPLLLRSYQRPVPLLLRSSQRPVPLLLRSSQRPVPLLLRSYQRPVPLLLRSYQRPVPLLLRSATASLTW
jgi:hypothetical protein